MAFMTLKPFVLFVLLLPNLANYRLHVALLLSREMQVYKVLFLKNSLRFYRLGHQFFALSDFCLFLTHFVDVRPILNNYRSQAQSLDE